MAAALLRSVVVAACTGVLAHAVTLHQGSELSAASQARLTQLEQDWSQELEGQAAGKKQSPVQRVVAVLQKMKSELEEEAKKDAEMYDKLACWCESNTKEKTSAIAEAEAKDAQLTAEIEARSARFGELSAEIDHLKEQITEDKEALKQAVALREANAAAFYAEQKDLVQAINNLENAVAVLAKHHDSFLQVDKPLMAGLRVLLRDAALKYELIAAADASRRGTAFLSLDAKTQAKGATAALLSALDARGADVPDALPLKFAQEIVERSAHQVGPATAAFLQAGKVPIKSYNAQSGQIFGILSQMLDEFKAQLAKSQAEAKKADEESRAVIAAKEAQIDAGKRKLDELQAEHATNQKALADAKEDVEATRKQRAADVEFLQNLKLQCNDIDGQWNARSSTRNAEIQAVAETVTILTEDDGRELLARSVSLLQVQSQQATSTEAEAHIVRERAAQSLRHAAQAPVFEADDLLAAWRGRRGAGEKALGAAAGPRAQLSTLAMSVQLDSFSKVKEAIDRMVAELKSQQEEEVQFKEYCLKELSQNEKAQYSKNGEKKDVEAKIEQISAIVENLEKEIVAATKQISDTQVAIKKASETREKDNAEFQSIVADQRATQELLRKALARLQDFYTKGIGKQVLVQRVAKQEPPAHFNAYKTNEGASPVMGLLEQIIEDSAKLEKEAVEGEALSQKTYETFVKDSNSVISELTEAVTTKTKAISAAQVEKADAESDLESAQHELDSLSDYEADLHAQCDWLLKNFDIRQKARLEETEAIQAAKAILSGAKGF